MMQRLSLICIVFSALSVQAQGMASMQPDEIVQATSDKLMEVLKKDSERLRGNHQDRRRLVDEILLPVIDFDAFSKLILGHNWRKATPAQRRRFIKEFKGMLIRTYTKYLVDYSGTQVKLIPNKRETRRDPKRQIVFTEVSQPGKPPLAVSYSFWLNGGAWKAYNVSVDGLSLVHLFRTEFDREINQTGLDALIDRLARTNTESNKDTAGKSGLTP
jgi:phospholipid transport system substrate-binding protein